MLNNKVLFWSLLAGAVITALFFQKFGKGIITACEKSCPPLAALLRLIGIIWMGFSHVLGIITSTIILTVLWIVGFGPYALVWKILHFFRKREKESYWIEHKTPDTHSLQQPF